METAICSELKTIVNKFFSANVQTSTGEHYCRVTLPMRTVDNRSVTILVEKTLGDFFLVHDGGKTDSSMFAQGIHISVKKEQQQARLAEQYGVTIANRLVQKLCRHDELNQTIFDVAQCTVLLTNEILNHRIEVGDETVARTVRRVLNDFHSPMVDQILRNVKIHGETASHQFNYVIHPKVGVSRLRAVAMKVLPATHAQWQAERFGFLGHDLRTRATYRDWARLVVVSKAEEWPRKALDIVNSFADDMIEIPSGQERDLEERLPASIESLMQQAA